MLQLILYGPALVSQDNRAWLLVGQEAMANGL